MGARVSREQNLSQLLQLIATSTETTFTRHQRALYERLLLNFQEGTNILELDESSAFELFIAISKYLHPQLETHNIYAERWMKEFDTNSDGKLDWTEYCNAVTTLLKGQTKVVKNNESDPDSMLSMSDLSLISKIN